MEQDPGSPVNSSWNSVQPRMALPIRGHHSLWVRESKGISCFVNGCSACMCAMCSAASCPGVLALICWTDLFTDLITVLILSLSLSRDSGDIPEMALCFLFKPLSGAASEMDLCFLFKLLSLVDAAGGSCFDVFCEVEAMGGEREAAFWGVPGSSFSLPCFFLSVIRRDGGIRCWLWGGKAL